MRPEDVPAGPVLVDTDVATWLLLSAPQAAVWRPLLRGHVLALSFVNVGELLALPITKGWQAARMSRWKADLRRTFEVVPFNAAITEQWAPLHIRYRGHLQKGGANDLWIAATALSEQPSLPSATNNIRDFGKIAADFPLTLVHPSEA
jgi:tRNA(fMet)-specific endonuclease VapC